MTFDFGAARPPTAANPSRGQPNWASIETAHSHNEYDSAPPSLSFPAEPPLIALASGETREFRKHLQRLWGLLFLFSIPISHSCPPPLSLQRHFGILLFSVMLFIEFKEPKLIRPERKILTTDTKETAALNRCKEEPLVGVAYVGNPKPSTYLLPLRYLSTYLKSIESLCNLCIRLLHDVRLILGKASPLKYLKENPTFNIMLGWSSMEFCSK